jgi:hypothetical protein
LTVATACSWSSIVARASVGDRSLSLPSALSQSEASKPLLVVQLDHLEIVDGERGIDVEARVWVPRR